jgi:hypothetical protein
MLFPNKGEEWEARLRFILYLPFYRTMSKKQKIWSVIYTIHDNYTQDNIHTILNAIDTGITSEKELSELLPQDEFTETELRQFLVELRPYVEKMCRGAKVEYDDIA